MSLHGIFSRGIRATLRRGSGGSDIVVISLIGAKCLNSEFPWRELLGEEESEV